MQLEVSTERARVRRSALANRLLRPSSSSRGARGFTLLELMIVISIIIILALVAMAQYNRTVLAAREATLKEDLFTMRKMIDQYAADKGKLPASLEDLQNAGYIHEIPIDPTTEQRDWQTEFGEDPGSAEGAQGVTNVRSASGEVSSDGSTRYNEW
ncbi:MAG: ral secretion pathway protein [Acidobacteriota bacterium]|jgi:general secretion pathway protein G|nr:ral secretion pathway protein [Acidobacteriota bacterium]